MALPKCILHLTVTFIMDSQHSFERHRPNCQRYERVSHPSTHCSLYFHSVFKARAQVGFEVSCLCLQVFGIIIAMLCWVFLGTTLSGFVSLLLVALVPSPCTRTASLGSSPVHRTHGHTLAVFVPQCRTSKPSDRFGSLHCLFVSPSDSCFVGLHCRWHQRGQKVCTSGVACPVQTAFPMVEIMTTPKLKFVCVGYI